MGLGTFEPRSNPIATNDLLAVVAPMLEADIPIKQEYNYAPRSQLFSWNHGKLPENRCKNRYGNLLPYDHTRVTLRKEPITTSSSSTTSSNGMTTDYMNANFIDGYKKVGRYIASQGPINATLDDFWRCVWQYHVQQIVMLTNLEESGKVGFNSIIVLNQIGQSNCSFISFVPFFNDRLNATNIGRKKVNTMEWLRSRCRKRNCLPTIRSVISN